MTPVFAAAVVLVSLSSSASPASAGYTYAGGRDPFRAPTQVAPPPPPCTHGTCRFGLDELTLVATVTSTGTPAAMVRDPEGVGHLVKRGSHLGRERATVVAVNGGSVVVEIARQREGRVERQRMTLSMAAEQAKVPEDLSFPEE